MSSPGEDYDIVTTQTEEHKASSNAGPILIFKRVGGNENLQTRMSSSHEEEYGPPPSQEDGNVPSSEGPCHLYLGKWPHQPPRQ